MEKCSFCVQRIRRSELEIEGKEGQALTDSLVRERQLKPACVQACPTGTLTFGDLLDPASEVSELQDDSRRYVLLEDLGTDPNVIYLKKVDHEARDDHH